MKNFETKVETAIGIIGKISSGKTTLAKKISTDFNIKIVSFGSYLFEYSIANNLPTDRAALQNLGESFIKHDSLLFLNKVLESQSKLPSIIIVEGIRHVEIFNALKKISASSYFIYVNAPEDIRFQRYLNRNKTIDNPISYDEFLSMNNHLVESEIDALMADATTIYNSHDSDINQSTQLETIYETIRSFGQPNAHS